MRLALLALALLPVRASADPSASAESQAPGMASGGGLKLSFSVGHAAGVGTFILDEKVPAAEAPKPAAKRQVKASRPRRAAAPPPQDHLALQSARSAQWPPVLRDAVKTPGGSSFWSKLKAKVRSASQRLLR